jgi:ribokinase
VNHVVVLGDINVDALMPVPDYPQPGRETVARSVDMQSGGSAANAAIVLARLGISVEMVGRVGADPWGDLALAALSAAGVGTGAVQRDPHTATGIMFTVLTPEGERTMFGYRGANPLTDPGAVLEGVFNGALFLHLSGYALLEQPQRSAVWRAVEAAEKFAIPIALDTAYYPVLTVKEEFSTLLPKLAVCILGVEEACELAGDSRPLEAALAVSKCCGGLVALKTGAEGCLLVKNGSEAIRVPGFPVQVQDTTGAGDAFSAGIIYGCLHGLDLPSAGTLANALGALAAAVHGAGSALPGRVEAKGLLETALSSASGNRAGWIKEAFKALLGKEN